MTRVVVATFADAEAARHAAVALGRAELAAGPTRVRVDASTPARGARLELRVDAPDAPRAIALMRDLGARVEDRDDPRDLRDAGPLAGWGMAVADAVTAAMGGATASDAQVPASGAAAPESGTARTAARGDAPPARAAGSGSGSHLSDTFAAGTASSLGQTGPGSSPAAAMGATDPGDPSRGTPAGAAPGPTGDADDPPPHGAKRPRRRPSAAP